MNNQIVMQLAQLEGATLPQEEKITIPHTSSDVNSAGEHLSDLINAADEATFYSGQGVEHISAAAGHTHTLGDAIMQRLDSMGTSFRVRVERTHHMLESLPGTYSLQEMLKLQLEMSAISVEIEVVGKGVQKAVQHADQLAKLQ